MKIVQSLVVVMLIAFAAVSQAGTLENIESVVSTQIKSVLDRSGRPEQGSIDVKLLRQNILEAQARVNAMPETSSKKVILTSANQTLEALATALEAGQWTPENLMAYYVNVNAGIRKPIVE